MSNVILVSREQDTIPIDRECLQRVSKVFRNMVVYETSKDSWALCDFSSTCLRQFVEFAESFQHTDFKLPTNIHSDQITDFVDNPSLVSFLQSKSDNEIFELLFLSNYIEYPLLYQLCIVQMACWMSIPAHAAMAKKFDLPLTVPSREFVSQLCKLSAE